MATPARYPCTASLYEAVRNRPGALNRLMEAGLTREHLELRLGDAASLLGVSVEQIEALIDREPVLAR